MISVVTKKDWTKKLVQTKSQNYEIYSTLKGLTSNSNLKFSKWSLEQKLTGVPNQSATVPVCVFTT